MTESSFQLSVAQVIAMCDAAIQKITNDIRERTHEP